MKFSQARPMRGGVRNASPRPGKAVAPAYFPAISKPVMWLFLVFVVFVYLQGGHRFPILGSFRLELLMAMVLFGLAIALRASQAGKRRKDPGGQVFGWGVALLLTMLLYVPLSVSPAASWGIFMDRGFKFAIFGFLISAFVVSPYVLRMFTWAYLLAFLKMGQEGVLGYITGSMVWENQGTPRLHGATPSYRHPNSFAGTQLSTLPFVAHFWRRVPRAGKLLLVFQGCAALLITVASGSRTAYVALLALVAFWFFSAKGKMRAIGVLAVVLGAAVVIVPDAYLERFNTIFTQKDAEGASIDLRKQIITDSLAIIAKYPMGVGVDAFPAARQAAFGRSQDTHNLYLQVLTNLGPIGFIIFSGYVISIFRLLVSTRHRIRRLTEACRKSGQAEEKDFGYIEAMASTLIGFLIVRLALGLFGHDLYELYWWFAGGTAIALSRITIGLEKQAADAGVPVEQPGRGPVPRFHRPESSPVVQEVTHAR